MEMAVDLPKGSNVPYQGQLLHNYKVWVSDGQFSTIDEVWAISNELVFLQMPTLLTLPTKHNQFIN